MATRSNALSELTRFWLEARHGCLVQESIPVPVPYAQSDLDFLAMHPRGESVALPDGAQIGPRFIVETKDEHDWEPLGKAFAADLLGDLNKLNKESGCIPPGTKGVKFSMLRTQHAERAAGIFGTPDFDRLFVVHAIDRSTLAPVAAAMTVPSHPRGHGQGASC